MKKRSLLLCLALVLSLTMAIGGTLAYLTETEYATNVMTLGNVDITIHDVQTNAAGEEEDFDQYQNLYPAVPGEDGKMIGELEKIVYLENTGSSDAYVRTILAFPALGNRAVTLDENSPIVFKYDASYEDKIQVVPSVTIDGKAYSLFVFTSDTKLAPGEKTAPSLLSFYMNPDVTMEDQKGFNGEYRIDVAAQAVQVENMTDAAQALYLGFGDIEDKSHPWLNGLPANPPLKVDDVADLQEALDSGKPVALAGDMTLDEAINIDKNANLDLNGKTLTIPAGTTGFAVSDGAELTLANGEVKVGGGDKAEAITVTNTEEGKTTTLNLENVEMTFDAYTDGDGDSVSTAIVAEAEEGNVVVNIDEGTEIYAEAHYGSPILAGKNAEIVLNNGSIQVKNPARSASGTSIYGVKLTDDTSVFTMNGGTITAKGSDGASAIYTDGVEATVNITGGTINVETTGGYGVGVEISGAAAKFSFTGGTINVKSTAGFAGEAFSINKNTNVTEVSMNATVNIYQDLWNKNYFSDGINTPEQTIYDGVTVNTIAE